MSNDLRGYTLTLTATSHLVTETCCECGVLYAMTRDFKAHRLADRAKFYCPNGHGQVYVGETAAKKLERAEAREVALKDQLAAAVRDAETLRVALLRDRQRFANGVCPCCNRSFGNVQRHMSTQHPDYDVTRIKATSTVRFRCTCGREFETLRGLRIHQGATRRDGWDKPSTPAWRSHLTAVK